MKSKFLLQARNSKFSRRIRARALFDLAAPMCFIAIAKYTLSTNA